MNVNDSEQIAALLASAGYEATGQAQKADVIILNTCSIREKAAQKVYSRLGRFKDYKLENPDIIIAVGGCLAQQWGEKFFKKAPCLDIVFGTYNIQNVPELIKRVQKSSRRITDTAFGVEGRFGGRLSRTVTGRSSAYVSIMQGCNNFCAYCVVPYLRGPEESREVADIVQEVENLAAQGVKEVTLLGQNVNSYGQTLRIKADFASLLRTIAAVGGIERIRFTTSHPKDISPELIRCFEEVDILCEHIHLPVQSGSDKVLRDMNRRYTRADYLQKVAALRAACPDISITSDVIVGFPGETDADFAETIDLLDKIRFDNLFSFKYSEREGTAAASWSAPALSLDGKAIAPLPPGKGSQEVTWNIPGASQAKSFSLEVNKIKGGDLFAPSSFSWRATVGPYPSIRKLGYVCPLFARKFAPLAAEVLAAALADPAVRALGVGRLDLSRAGPAPASPNLSLKTEAWAEEDSGGGRR